MAKRFWIFGVIALTTLAACGDTNLQRALSGAAIGGVAAGVTNNDVATGAALGATAGALCNGANVCP